MEQNAKLHQPHIVLFLADELGWGDVGYHSSQIKTPFIDALAEVGTRLNRFYVMSVCSPTNGALMTGRYQFIWVFNAVLFGPGPPQSPSKCSVNR